MNNYLINNNKNWIDIIIDGKGGLNDNNLLLCKFLNINIVNFKDSKDELLSIIYYDDNLLQIKSIIGNEFNIDSSIITTVNSPIIDLIAFTDSNKNYTLFYYDTTTLYYISQKFKINTQILNYQEKGKYAFIILYQNNFLTIYLIKFKSLIFIYNYLTYK
jgi:hypothetical protein